MHNNKRKASGSLRKSLCFMFWKWVLLFPLRLCIKMFNNRSVWFRRQSVCSHLLQQMQRLLPAICTSMLKVEMVSRSNWTSSQLIVVKRLLPGRFGNFILLKHHDHFLTWSFFVLFVFFLFYHLFSLSVYLASPPCNRFERCFITQALPSPSTLTQPRIKAYIPTPSESTEKY